MEFSLSLKRKIAVLFHVSIVYIVHGARKQKIILQFYEDIDLGRDLTNLVIEYI